MLTDSIFACGFLQPVGTRRHQPSSFLGRAWHRPWRSEKGEEVTCIEKSARCRDSRENNKTEKVSFRLHDHLLAVFVGEY